MKHIIITSAFLISIAVVGTTQAERLRMYTDRTAQENIIAGPVRVIDTTNQTGSITLDDATITKWSDVAAFSTGSVASVFGRSGIVEAQEGDYSAFYATGTPLYVESDPVWLSEKSGYATGTPLYVESDPVWIAEKSNYATGTPVYTESDPVWSTYLSDTFTGAVESIAGESGISSSIATTIAETVLSASLDSVSTDTAADKQYVLDNAPALTRATWVEMGAPPENWTISDTNGSAQIWRTDVNITNIVPTVSSTNYLAGFTVKLFCTNSVNIGNAEFGGAETEFTNTVTVFDVLIDGDYVELFLLREGDE